MDHSGNEAEEVRVPGLFLGLPVTGKAREAAWWSGARSPAVHPTVVSSG